MPTALIRDLSLNLNTVIGGSFTYIAYVVLFGGAAAACLVSLGRARRIQDDETRYGMVGLLAFSGGWAAFQAGFLVVPTPGLRYASYLVSLIVGLATIGAWLYFCSAYTGRTLHRNSTLRQVAVVAYLTITIIKVTNPLHGLYFSLRLVQEPFVHATVVHGTFHWLVTGLSYVLVAIGFFMLYESFTEAGYDTRPLIGALGVTAIPVLFDVVGYTTDALLDLNHESIGVAAFALSVLYLFDKRFLSVQVTGSVDDAVIFLDESRQIRDFNQHALAAFPELAGSEGQPLSSVLPQVSECAEEGGDVLEVDRDGETRYYLVGESSFSLDQNDYGQVLVFADATTTERRRRELERQNEQLEGLAAAIRHELRNTLQIVRGRVTIAGEALDRGEVSLARESFETASETSDRMSRVVDDLSAIAEYGQSIEGTRHIAFEPVVEEAWTDVDPTETDLTVEGRGEIRAERGRLHALFVNVFRFYLHNDASSVRVQLRDDGFAVADDGASPSVADPDVLFDYDGAVPDAQTGVTLPNMRMLARAHGWEAAADPEYEGGVRIVVSGASVEPRELQTV